MRPAIIVCCETLGFEESFQGYCFGHAFSKAYQYATTKNKICKKFEGKVHYFYLIKFAKMHNMAKEILKRQLECCIGVEAW